jgi:inner membrane protein
MDPFTHTLVGLTAAKTGLERLSPLATTVCVLAASSPDSDVLVGFVTDRWTYLHHHRGITHSIFGVIALAFIVPALVWAAERGYARARRIQPRSRYRGLLVASLVVTATHPLLDWTNNYGVRPFLPWSGRWFYGDLVFIVDPYLILIAGAAAFLGTNRSRPKMIVWALFAAAFVVLSFVLGGRRDPGFAGVTVARIVLLVGVVSVIVIRLTGIIRGRERVVAGAALALIVLYWAGLAFVHRVAYNNASAVASAAVAGNSERVARVAAMPTLANPLLWSCVAETDRAIYRFFVRLGEPRPQLPLVDGYRNDSPNAIERYEKPTGRAAELSQIASQDRRAQILLNFARFPLARPQDENCVSQTIVQIADLRYTEPGAPRGIFSLNVPVECASK